MKYYISGLSTCAQIDIFVHKHIDGFVLQLNISVNSLAPERCDSNCKSVIAE